MPDPPTINAVVRGSLENLAALLALVALVGLFRDRLLKRSRRLSAWVVGVLFGGAAVFAMTFPLTMAAGVMVDCRFGVLGLAGLVGGLPAAVSAAAVASGYRLLVGGPLAWSGVASICLASLAGAIAYRRFRADGTPLAANHVNRLSVELSLVALAMVVLAMLAALDLGSWSTFLVLTPFVVGIVFFTTQFLGRLILLDQARVATAGALVRQQRQLETTLNSIGDAVIACDATGRITHINRVASELTGWGRRSAVGKPLQDVCRLVDELTGSPIQDPVARTLREGKVTSIAERTMLEPEPPGERRQIAYTAAPIQEPDVDATGVVVVFRDISEELSLQRQLQQTQKLESVGRLAGGIAHDFNNLLAVVIGNVELLGLKLPQSDGFARPYLKRIEEAALRGSSITRQLLLFSRRGGVQRGPVSVHEVIREVIGLVEHTFDRRIEIRERLAAVYDVVNADAGQLQQAFLNLALNARDAMSTRGGTLVFASQLVEGSEKPAQTGEAKPSRYLEIDVRDTGDGIAPEHLDKVFDPFFTTKAASKGTGLGLASVYGAVDAHGGSIDVWSRPGQGTEFRLRFPLQSEARTSYPDVDSAETVRGTGRILIVEDEAEVQAVLRGVLTDLGYSVTAREDGSAGLETFRERPDDFDLVLLDVNMPVLSGIDCFEQMQRVRPGVRGLFVTGHAQPELKERLRELGARGVVGKPFTLLGLSQAVASALAPSPGSSAASASSRR
jgi:PAS domain S-box-containing protein